MEHEGDPKFTGRFVDLAGFGLQSFWRVESPRVRQNESTCHYRR